MASRFKCIPWRKKEDNISLNIWSQIQLNYCGFCNAKKKCFCNFFGRICIECYFDGTFVDSAVKLSSYHPTFVRVWLFPLATEFLSLHFLCFRCTAQLYLRPFHLLIKLKKNKNIFEFLISSYLCSLDTIMRWQRARFMFAVNTISQHVKAKTMWALAVNLYIWFFRQTFGVVSLLDKALNKTSVIKLWLKGSMFYCFCLRFKPILGVSLYTNGYWDLYM